MESVGIIGLEVYVPSRRLAASQMAAACSTTAEQVVEQTGVTEKAVGAPDDTPTAMGLKAAGSLLGRNRVPSDRIDYVIFAGSGVYEKRFWSPAAKVQAGLGADRALAFEVCNGCSAGNLGLQLAAGLLRGNSRSQHALLVVSDALSGLVDYSDPGHMPLFNFADAATAVLLGKGTGTLRLLAFSAITRPEFVDCLSLPATGGRIERSVDAPIRERLGRAYLESYSDVIRDACGRAGIRPVDLRRLFINQGDHRLIGKLAGGLGLGPEVPYRSYQRLGHLGGSDVFLGLRACLDASELRDGDMVALATSAIGFSWGCTVIQI